MPENNTPKRAEKKDLVVTRISDAPLERVWKAWTDPEQVMRWWGPNGFTAPVAKIDFREGGTSLVCMRSPEYGDQYSTWRYEKIAPVERIEYIHNLADKDGNKVDPVKLGMPPISRRICAIRSPSKPWATTRRKSPLRNTTGR